MMVSSVMGRSRGWRIVKWGQRGGSAVFDDEFLEEGKVVYKVVESIGEDHAIKGEITEV